MQLCCHAFRHDLSQAVLLAAIAVRHDLDQCMPQMLRNLVEVLRLLATAKPSASGAGLELLLAARGSEDGGAAAQLPPRQSSHAYVQREADAAWDCVQVSTSSIAMLTCIAEPYHLSLTADSALALSIGSISTAICSLR